MMRPKTRDDLGLALTMLDSDRLRQWAEKLDTYGSDISHWADRRFVSEQLRAVAGRIEDTVREVGTLRELAGIEPDVRSREDAIPPVPGASPVKFHECIICEGICTCADAADASPKEPRDDA